jgi:hypothetical protein
MKKRPVATLVVIVALFASWYAFRPERLVVNKRAQESAPASSARSLEALSSGPCVNFGTAPLKSVEAKSGA